jgi:hypothetical protein
MSKKTYKLFADKLGGTDANNFIGTSGELFYDTTGETPIRISDGVTPGGIPFAIKTNNQNYDPQFQTVSGNTLPGTVSTGSFVKQGLIVHFRVNVNFANTTDFGANSQYQITLPFPIVSTTTIRGGTLHNEGTDARFHIAGITDIDDSSPDANTTMRLYYSGSTTDLAWKSSTPVSATANTSHFDISGAYETISEI